MQCLSTCIVQLLQPFIGVSSVSLFLISFFLFIVSNFFFRVCCSLDQSVCINAVLRYNFLLHSVSLPEGFRFVVQIFIVMQNLSIFNANYLEDTKSTGAQMCRFPILDRQFAQEYLSLFPSPFVFRNTFAIECMHGWLSEWECIPVKY